MVKCVRCDVELEELPAVLLNEKFEDMKPGSEFFWVMLYGGEVRKYLPFECPKCGQLFLFRQNTVNEKEYILVAAQ